MSISPDLLKGEVSAAMRQPNEQGYKVVTPNSAYIMANNLICS